MIFGIKTRKDKKIDELQKEIDKLKFQPLKIIEQPISVSTIGASYVLDKWNRDIIKESWIKGILADRLAEELIRRGLPVEKVEMSNGNAEYRVRVRLIVNDLYRN